MLKRFKILFLAAFALLMMQTASYSADHVDAPIATANPELDITDVYAFLDPQDASQVVVAMAVNPFLQPGTISPGFGTDVLYQFKFDNTGDGVEDYVVQAVFSGSGDQQQVDVFASAVEAPIDLPLEITTPVASGNTGEVIESGDFRVFAGIADDAFVFDFGQFTSILAGEQDVFRGGTLPILGELRGRAPGEATDLFAGQNASHIVVSFPKSIVDNGDGFFDGLAGTNVVGIWATTSRDGSQMERMGQQVVNTVFIPEGMKDDYNAATPADDMEMFAQFVPDALTQEDNDGTNNTINGRRAVLQLTGLDGLPASAPLFLPEDFVHPLDQVTEGAIGRDLLRIALLPDVIRLDLDLAPGNLAPGVFGLQNGRRPQDDAIDIGLQLLRHLADVKFPDGATVDVGEDTIPVPGSGPMEDRAALDCGNPEFPMCNDRRVLVVLQGTDFTTPDSQIEALDYTTSGNDQGFVSGDVTTARLASDDTSPDFGDTEFPFMAVAQVDDDPDPAPDNGDDDSGCALASSGTAENTAAAFMLPALVFGIVFGRRMFRR